MAFVKDDPAQAASLVASMQKLTQVNKAKDLRAFVVFTSGPEVKNSIQKVAADKKITIPLTFLPGGPGAGDFQAYKVNPEAHNTVLVYNRHTVTANFVNVNEKSFPEVEKATAAMLAKK